MLTQFDLYEVVWSDIALLDIGIGQALQTSKRDLMKIQKQSNMITLKSASVLLLLVILAQTQYPTSNCPQLCAQNCTSTGSCSICYQTFLVDALNSTCACPSYTYKGANGFCQLCPVFCDTCTNSTRCTSCMAGYMLSNSYSCIPATTNNNGWVSISVTEHIQAYSDMLQSGAQNLIWVNGSQPTNITVSNRQGYLTTCTNLAGSWFGGYQRFSYSSKIIYTAFSLPLHQWINVRFHAVLIDNWRNNTFQVELSSASSYDPNTVASPRVVWSARFDSSIRKYDFCGNSSFGDNLALVNLYTYHNASEVQVLIRLNQSDLAVPLAVDSLNLQELFFGVTQFIIRVGTCGRHCMYCSGPLSCSQCYRPYVAVNGQCVCNASLGVGFPTETGCSFNCAAGQYYQADLKTCVSCNERYENCQSCDSTKCQVCNIGYFFYQDVSGAVSCLKYCPDNYTQARGVEALVNGQTVERDQCIACSTNCLTCNLDICIFCKPGYQYHQGSCLSTCPLGFFSKLSTCTSCSVFGKCSNCTVQGCTACEQGLAISNGICKPICYVNSTVSITASCNFTCLSPCSSCYGPEGSQCLSCITSYKLFKGQCASACPQTTYDNGVSCEPCPVGCSTCSNSTFCLSCLSGYYFTASSCNRLCPAATFPSLFNLSYISPFTYNTTSFSSIANQTAYLSSTCLPCSVGCTRCLDALTCFACQREYFLFNFTCFTEEVEDYEWEDERFRKCGANCNKCTHQICTACNAGWFLERGECVQECPVGKYKREVWRSDVEDHSYSVMVCAWKNPLCQEYSPTISDGSCLKCSYTYPATALVSMTVHDRQLAICSFACPDFYTKTQNLTCIPCPDNCRRCTPQMVCLKCLDNYVINAPENITAATVMNQTCLRHVCGDGQFSDSLQCQPCPTGCQICLLDGSCYVCLAGFTIEPYSKICIPSGSSQLNQFTIVSGGATTTGTCSSLCRSCAGSSVACTSCPINPANQTYLFNSTCTVGCPSGFFMHPASRTCRRCDPRCSSCTEITNCLTCTHDFYLLDFYDPRHASCVPECPVGFWVNGTTCQRCYKDCKKCYGPSEYQCLECYPNFFIEEGKCVYQCDAMMYRDRGTGHCQWCHPSCQECDGPTKQGCISCNVGYFYYDHRCFANECPGATYLSIPARRLCQPCQYGCQYCSSSQFCHFCTPGLYFYRGWCYNKCPGSLKWVYERYYNNLLGQICAPCQNSYSATCQRCDLYSCKKCQGNYYLYRLSTQTVTQNGQSVIQQCFSSCPEGTFAIAEGNRECVRCSPHCDKCSSYYQCTECDSGYRLINGYCSSYCPAGNYQNAQSCYSCPTYCQSCTNSSFCTSCKTGYSLYYSSTYNTMSCVSPCPPTYYNHPANWCLKCPNKCVFCTNATYCTQCLSNASPVNGICYGSSTDACISQCQVCTSGVCQRCVNPLLLYRNPDTGVSSCVSVCPQGYFMSGFSCSKCNATCASCNNTMNNCTACVAGLYRRGQECLSVCPVGSYADPTTATCLSCPSNCLNCYSSSCYLCSSGYYLYQSSCYSSCPTSTFLIPSTQMCFPCSANCLGCTDIENCTSCASGFYLYNRTCLDSCPQTSYLLLTESTGVCRSCAAPCYTCTTASACLSCVGGYVLNGTQCQEQCGDGYYLHLLEVSYNDEVDDQNFTMYGQCEPCSVNCRTCTNSSNYCLSCPTGLLLASGICVDNCPTSTLPQGTVCVSCPPLCLQCSSASACLACVSSATLFSGSCLTSCPVGYYRALVSDVTLSSASYSCAACSSNCLSCSGQSQYSCLSCSPGYYYTDGMCLSTCPQGTFANNATGSCSPCPVTCAKCLTFAYCQECIANYTLTNTYQCQMPTPPTCSIQYCMTCATNSSAWCDQCVSGFKKLSGACLTACPQGTYNREGTCVLCTSNCTSCGQDGCRTCFNGSYLYQGYCYAVCPTGTKIYGSQCVADPCQQYDSTGGCLSCSSPYLLHEASHTCVLTCPARTVRSSSQCVNCSFNCLSCVSPSSCSSCIAGTYLHNGACYYTCPIGTYADGGSCKQCTQAYCQQCSNAATCTVCQPGSGAFLVGGNCLLDCPSGTYRSQEASQCVSCSSGCLQCLNSSLCQSCQSSLLLYQGQCLSVCPSSTYPSAGSCASCPSTCNACTSSTSCSSCVPGYSLSPQNSQTLCLLSCPSGTFTAMVASSQFNNSYVQSCVACFSPCRTCYQSGASCTSCVEGYNLQGTGCYSECSAGQYPAIVWSTSIWGWSFQITICLSCPYACPTCSNSNTCTSCRSGYNLDANGNCISNCSQTNQYYNSVTRQCLNCSSTCYTCFGPLVTNCLSCYPDYYLSAGSCLSTCPFGYYATPTFTCALCNANCADCEGSATNCTVCPAGGYLQLLSGVSSCTVQCLTGFYADSSSSTCRPCHASCLNCTGQLATKCSVCPSTAFLSQGSCLTQCPSGTAPVTTTVLNCIGCPSGCSVCTNTSTTAVSCTQCQSSLYLYHGQCVSACPVGTYPSLQSYSCQACGIDGCYRCVYNSSMQVQCLSCQPGYYMLGTTGTCVTACPSGYILTGSTCEFDPVCRLYIYNGLCLSSCPEGTFPVSTTDSSNLTVTTCTTCSASCLLCSSASVCQQCSGAALLVTISNVTSCVSVCPTGYYNSSGNCLVCTAPCVRCYQAASTVTCSGCAAGYYLLNGQCLTVCPSGYFASGSSCSVCSSQCAQCSVSASNCTQCKTSTYLTPACASLNCSVTQYQDLSGNCLNCHTNCYSCYGGNSYECTSCSSGTYFLEGQCLTACPEGYTTNGTVCVLCPSHCQTCTGSTCTTCLTGYLLTNGQCLASCSQLNTATATYYATNSTCVLCSSTVPNCLVCSTAASPISCLQCQTGKYLYQGSCLSACPSGFFNTSTFTCSACSANCTTCASATVCTQCLAGTVLSSGQCIALCPTGSYLATTASNLSTCSACPDHCLACTSAGCSSCVQPYALLGTTCGGCIAGYYWSVYVGICAKCSAQCKTCSVTSANCTSCAVGYYQYSTSCIAACPTGYYPSSSGVCTVCSTTNCSSCPQNVCTACATGTVKVVSGGVLTCAASCPSATFLDAATATCVTCSSNCQSCTSATSCTSCTNGSLYNGYCFSTCPTGYTSVSAVCAACPVGCKTCSSLTTCLSCDSGLVLNTNGSCTINTTVNCSAGYFPNALGSCTQCYPTCQTCLGALSSNCLSCFTGSNLVAGVCVQDCTAGYFFNNATMACSLCSSLFAHCASCTSAACTVCDANYTLSGGSCQQSCPSGTYLSNQQCYSCSSFCLTCTSATNCTACMTGLTPAVFLYNGGCYSSCPDQTYNNGTTCAPCLQTCLTCAVAASNCSSCLTPYNLLSWSCVVTCPNGTYSSNYVCTNCSSNCLLCAGASSCTSCASGYYLIEGACRSTCVAGYYIDPTSNRCLQCVAPCDQCSSRTACTTCIAPYLLSGANCISNCSAGAYYNTSLSGCINCSLANCGVCTQNTCLACAADFYSYYLSGSIVGCLSSCYSLTATFADASTMNCSACYSYCERCTNASYCELCDASHYLLSATSGVNECVAVCPLGYFETLIRTCQACGTNCNECQNTTYCDVCQSNYYRFTSQSIATATNVSCVPQCPTGYGNPTIIDGLGLCFLCPSRCLVCADTTTCTQCFYSSDVLLSGACTPSNCLNCQTCDNASNLCTQCVSGFVLYQGSCTAFCPQGYYPDYQTGKCEKCLDNCVACFSKNTCAECINGYIFVNSSATCENEGYINFGTLGNMSGFTSNVTEIMATVYVGTSAGPIAFGALSSTYGVMQVCQFMYLMQGSTSGNEELSTFLDSLSIVSYTSGNNNGNTSSTTNTTASSSRRRLTATEYTSSFLQTNLPIFLMMIGFVCAYFLVLLFTKYNDSCCSSCPNLQKYVGYICQFMQKRFKFIYVDLVMWISYLPFLYFAMLQIKTLKFDSGINAISSLIAFVIIIVYPLYPAFILRKLFDKSDDPAENLKNYKAISLLLPLDLQVEANRPLCASFQCCPKDNPDMAMIEMSLSPYIDKVVRPVYNQDVPEYAEFKYCTLAHWRLAYAAVKYVRKFFFVLLVVVCPEPATTLGLLVALSVIYMVYLIALKPKQKLYLILEVILQSLILFFEIFMLIYVTTGGATVTALSIVAHAVGFAMANSTLAIAIILNIMAYYTIFCCIYDLIKHMKAKVEEEDLNQIKQQLEIDQKDGFKLHDGDYDDYPEDAAHRDLEKEMIKKYGGDIDKELGIKKRKKGDDEATEENDEDYVGGHYDLDEKEFNLNGSEGNNSHHPEDGEELPNLRQTRGPSKKQLPEDVDKELAGIKLDKKKGDDEHTEQNDDDWQNDPMTLDEKEFNVRSSMINKKKKKESKHEEGEDLPSLHQSRRRSRKKQSKKDIPAPQYDDNTEDDMVKSKFSNESNPDVNEGLLKEREKDRFKRDVGGDKVNVGKGDLREPTDKFRRGRGKQGPEPAEQESMDYLFVSPNAKEKEYRKETVEEVGTNDKIRQSPSVETPEGKPVMRQVRPNEKGNKESELEDVAMKERKRKLAADPFGEFEQILEKEKEPASLAMKEREKVPKNDIINNNLLFVDDEPEYIQRQPQSKAQKGENKFYKGSDDQEQIGEVTTKERKGHRFKRGTKPVEQPDIGAVGYDINTKKAEKKTSPKEFAEDDVEELKYKERQGQAPQKKNGGFVGQTGDNLDQVRGVEREKRKANNNRPSVFQNLEENMAESITIGTVERANKPRAPPDDDFQQINMGKQERGKADETRRGKDRGLKMGQNLEESYDDVVKKNRDEVFKPKNIGQNSGLLDIEDDFEEVSYERPASRMQKGSEKNKDTGLLGSYREGQIGGESSIDVRKRRSSNAQKLRKKSGHLDVGGNFDDGEDVEASQDSRRISKVVSKKKIKSGVLNIQNNSDADDIQEIKFHK